MGRGCVVSSFMRHCMWGIIVLCLSVLVLVSTWFMMFWAMVIIVWSIPSCVLCVWGMLSDASFCSRLMCCRDSL